MQYKTYGVIEVSSYGVSLEIYEISRKNGIKQIDYIRYPLELGKDSFVHGKIRQPMAEELCRIISDFTTKMKGYQVDDYKAVATSALREAMNSRLVLNLIKQRTGVSVQVYSNSELRFIGYKAIASNQADFEKIIQKGTAIVDVGAGSIQVSLFDKDNLISTQNIVFGNLRIRERLAALRRETNHYETLVSEMIAAEVTSYKKMHLKDRKIPHVILTGDFLSDFLAHNPTSELKDTMSKDEYIAWYEKVVRMAPLELAENMGIAAEYATLLVPTAILYKIFVEELGAELIWIPGMELSDGVAYEYAEKNKLIKPSHNFENDILMAARNIGKRYAISKSHITTMNQAALVIFDSMRKVHGLDRRHRLLLEIAVHLHDCGKYISMAHVADCSYNIIMSTEIIGLSHRERQIIALVVRANTQKLGHYDDEYRVTGISEEDYILVAKLTAILRLANALDRTHQQKIEEIRAVLQERRLVIRLTTKKDYTLEMGLLEDKTDFFEEVFDVRPEIRLKKLV